MRALIAILSCAQHAERRQAIRQTWLRGLRKADYRFFIGATAASKCWDSPHDEEYVNAPDDYQSLARKVEAAVMRASMWGYDFVFKCDDDTYVRTDQLLASGFETHDYSGFIEDRDCHFRAFNFPVYPHAAGGPGYWLSRKAMDIVATGLPDASEDFAVGEVLSLAGISWFHDERYVHEDRKDRDDILRSAFISLHKCDPAEMRRVHKQVTKFCPVMG